MTQSIDTAMLELLASKICHDLINPIGAINNGLEFMEDMGPDAGPEARELIAFSANQATAKLQAFRLAYGVGGADGNVKLSDVHKSIEQIVSLDKKITQEWDPNANLGPLRNETAFCKIFTCALLLAIECLPRGGKILVSGDGNGVIVRVEGTNAALTPNSEKALTTSSHFEAINPKDVHACMSGLMARQYQFALTKGDAGDGFTSLRITKS